MKLNLDKKNYMNWNANGNYVIIEPDVSKEQTESGLFIPESARLDNTGTVISVGNGAYEYGCFVESWKHLLGKTVYYRPNSSAHDITLDGKKYVAVHQNDIILYK